MSWECQAWVWKQRLPGNEKWVLMGLANYVDQEGKCWPSLKKLASDLGIAHQTIGVLLNKLEEKGFIRREHRRRQTTIYHFPDLRMKDSSIPESGILNSGHNPIIPEEPISKEE